MNYLKSKKILIGVTGSIAIYKTCELIRMLQKKGADVHVIMTDAAKKLIQPAVFQALTGHQVLDNLFENTQHIDHIQYTRTADALLICPCTANTVSKIAHGQCNDLLSTLSLARDTCPLIIAPAMNQAMWSHPATQRNIQQIIQDGVMVIQPDTGDMACKEHGTGRLANLDTLIEQLQCVFAPKPLKNTHILMTAGRTQEPIDPVRVLTNHSSGKMGAALAQEAIRLGAQVTFVHGAMDVHVPHGVNAIPVKTALNMHQAVLSQTKACDIFIGVAAVSDWGIANPASEKIKKSKNNHPEIEWFRNPDILYDVAHLENPPFCVGFAAETNHIIEYAQKKLQKKNIDMIIANPAESTFGADTTSFIICQKDQTQTVKQVQKTEAATIMLNRIASAYQTKKDSAC
ncbi:MAG: bifunctional phosphopantothenoylcysteine decarboxylase/phosphopantothenate--cysteine ligase CoaBC [Alcaligenaceae bacterium]|nr:bifunctional phosphopantothenoylcysteine decarboxylase/phosphopantothenate--cysteine ligase CoaBC [Alcaligenaceae bacterium]